MQCQSVVSPMAINQFTFQFQYQVIVIVSNLLFLLDAPVYFNKICHSTGIPNGLLVEHFAVLLYVFWCDVLNATHEPSINLLCHAHNVSSYCIFQYEGILAHRKTRKPSHQLAQNDSLIPCQTFSHFIHFVFRFAASLWLNKILCPIVIVSWCSFNFCWSVCCL